MSDIKYCNKCGLPSFCGCNDYNDPVIKELQKKVAELEMSLSQQGMWLKDRNEHIHNIKAQNAKYREVLSSIHKDHFCCASEMAKDALRESENG